MDFEILMWWNLKCCCSYQQWSAILLQDIISKAVQEQSMVKKRESKAGDDSSWLCEGEYESAAHYVKAKLLASVAKKT